MIKNNTRRFEEPHTPTDEEKEDLFREEEKILGYLEVISAYSNEVIACCMLNAKNHKVLKDILEAMYPYCKIIESYKPMNIGDGYNKRKEKE